LREGGLCAKKALGSGVAICGRVRRIGVAALRLCALEAAARTA